MNFYAPLHLEHKNNVTITKLVTGLKFMALGVVGWDYSDRIFARFLLYRLQLCPSMQAVRPLVNTIKNNFLAHTKFPETFFPIRTAPTFWAILIPHSFRIKKTSPCMLGMLVLAMWHAS